MQMLEGVPGQVYEEMVRSKEMCGCPAAHCLQNQYSQMVEKKVAFNQNAGNLGRRWTQHSPKNNLQRFCLAMKTFKGKQGSNLS